MSNLPFTGLPLDDVGNSEWERTAAAEDELVEELAVFFLEGSEKKLELEAETAAEEELEAAGLLLLLLEEDTDAELELEETALTLRFFTVPGVFRSVISSLPTIRSETSSPDAAPCAIGSWAEKAVAAAVWLQSNITARAASRAEGVSSTCMVAHQRMSLHSGRRSNVTTSRSPTKGISLGDAVVNKYIAMTQSHAESDRSSGIPIASLMGLVRMDTSNERKKPYSGGIIDYLKRPGCT